MIAKAIPTARRRPWRRLARGLVVLTVALLVLLAALWALLRIALLPQTDDWAVNVGRGPLQLRASVPQLVWLATTPWIGPRLDGWRVRTAHGPLTLGWVPAGQEGQDGVLTLHCEPCTVPLPPQGLGQQQITVPALQLALSREAVQNLRGTVLAGAAAPNGEAPVLRIDWRAVRSGPGWRVTLNAPSQPVRHWVALLAPQLPELSAALIDGTLALHGEVLLPSGPLQLQPVLSGLAVSGLGTESLAGARASCGTPVQLPARAWLTRAVLAAEDQRFFEHPGYDLQELSESLARNQQAGAVRRGASTLTQQLAKLMVTGDERTLARKLRELLVAVEMEQTLGKSRILQLYLNHAPWGHDASGQPICGAEAAARHYFGVGAARLSARQAVTLAAMLRNPQREAARWADEGSVDRARLIWVAQQIRGVPIRQRRALAGQLQTERAQATEPAADAVPMTVAADLP